MADPIPPEYLPPPGPIDATLNLWKNLSLFYRVHPAIYREAQFNPSPKGNARFSPLPDATGAIISTLYAGTTLDCALMETVFHNVPAIPGPKSVSQADSIDGKVSSALQLTTSLTLIDLRTIALKKMGTDRLHLIDTESILYPASRQWASRLYTEFPKAQGMFWTSRQDDSATSFVLFGSRIPTGVLTVAQAATSLTLPDNSPRLDVIDLAQRLGVDIVP